MLSKVLRNVNLDFLNLPFWKQSSVVIGKPKQQVHKASHCGS